MQLIANVISCDVIFAKGRDKTKQRKARTRGRAVLAAPWRRRWMCTRSPTRGRSPTSRRWPTNRMRRTPLHSAPQRPSRTSGGCTCTCAGPWTSAQRFATTTSSARGSAPCGRTTPTATVANGSCGSKRALSRASGRILCAAHCTRAAPLRRTRHEKGAHPDLPVALCAAIGHPRRSVPRGRRDLRLRALDSLPRGHPLRVEQIRRLAPRLHADPRHDALRHVPARERDHGV